jgi:transcriptional regulator with XRE-family HTH domain
MDKKSYDRLLIGIGQTLAEARANAGMTQDELGKQLEKVQSAVAKIERAPSPNIALRVIYETASALGLSLSEVFARAEALVGIEGKHKEKESSKKGLSREIRRAISDIVSTNLQKTNDEIIRQLTTIDT